MRRRVFTLCSALSLLLCAAVCVLWVRSYWRIDTLTRWHFGVRTYHLRSERGGVRAYAFTSPPASKPPPEMDLVQWTFESGPVSPHGVGLPWEADRPSVLGFKGGDAGWITAEIFGTVHLVFATVPYWFLTFGAAGLSTMLLSRRWRAVRHCRPGFCPRCDYDLRASPERCPECGAAATPETAATR